MAALTMLETKKKRRRIDFESIVEEEENEISFVSLIDIQAVPLNNVLVPSVYLCNVFYVFNIFNNNNENILNFQPYFFPLGKILPYQCEQCNARLGKNVGFSFHVCGYNNWLLILI